MNCRQLYKPFTWIMFILCLEVMVVSVLPHHHHHHHVCLLHDSEFFCEHEGEDHHDANPESGQEEDTCITNFKVLLSRQDALEQIRDFPVMQPGISFAEIYNPLYINFARSAFEHYQRKIPIQSGISIIFSLRAPPASISC